MDGVSVGVGVGEILFLYSPIKFFFRSLNVIINIH